MLAKKFRLPIQSWNKKNQKKTSATQKTKYFIAKTTLNNLPFSRFGIIISRKVSKKTVQRNKIKRIIFNFIKSRQYHLEAGRDTLIVVSPVVGQLTKPEIEKELDRLIIQ